MKKKLIALALALCLVLVAVPGCGDLFKPSDEDKYDPKTTVTIAVPASTGSTEKLVMEKLAAAYLAKNPACEVAFKVQEINGGYVGEINQLASAGVLPDIFLSGDSDAYLFASNQISLDLSTYIEGNADYKATIDDIYPTLLDMCRFDGRVFALPREYPRMVVYYNKKIFTDAGLAFPENGWTWSQFRQTAKTLTTWSSSTDGDPYVSCYGSSLRVRWTSAIIPVLLGLNEDAKFFEADGKTAAIDESMLSGLDELREMVLEGSLFNEYAPDNASFANQGIAMYVSISGDVPKFSNSLGENKFDVVSMPTAEKGSIGTGTSGFAVSNNSAHKDDAVDFLFFVASEEGQNILGEQNGNVPVRKSMAKTGKWTETYKGYNLDAFLYKPGYDAPTLTSMLADKTKTAPTMEAVMSMIEKYIAKTTATTTPAERAALIKTFNKSLNDAQLIG